MPSESGGRVLPSELPRDQTGWRNSIQRYGSLSMALHWLMLVLLAAVYASIELRELFPKGSDPREALKHWHYMLGLSVLVLVWLRLAVHMIGPVPRIEPEPAAWQKLLAKLMHVALYVLMIGMPIQFQIIIKGVIIVVAAAFYVKRGA